MNKVYILCAATWLPGGPTLPHSPVNCEEGCVFAGHRHCSVLSVIWATIGPSYKTMRPEQGFLTSDNRFVDRKEAIQIALDAGQVQEDELHSAIIGLFSEDLY